MVDGHPQQQQVNLAELLEVRHAGLSAQEVLAMLAASCEHLIRASNRRGLFTREQLFVTQDGRVEVQLVPVDQVPKQLVPPELLDHVAQPFGQGSGDSHLVWCLGKSCAQASSADHSDVTLHSLLNLMTVQHVQSRPSLQKVRQMIRNRLELADLERVPEVIGGLFRELMGDLDELMEDPFGDDIRFSSSRSSHLSIIPGPGAPEQRERRDLEAYQQELATEVADRLRRDFSLSRKHSQGGREMPGNPFDEPVDIPDQLHRPHPPPSKPVPSPRRVISPPAPKMAREDDTEEEEEELTPRGPSPAGRNPFEGEDKELEQGGRSNPFFNDSDNEEEDHGEQHNKSKQFRPNAESIQVEVHASPYGQQKEKQQQQHSSESSGQSPSTLPKAGGRLYAKAGPNKAGRGAATAAAGKRATQEIEILPAGQEKHPQPEAEPEEEFYADEDLTDTPPAAASSTGTRTAQILQQHVTKSEERPPAGNNDGTLEFRRQNSLQPGRCSRRASSGGRQGMGGRQAVHTRLPAVPEFLANSSQPNIRLRAQSMKRKKLVVSLHRSEPAVVLVRLLDGHSVEVNCRTDQLVGAIFHTVAEHLDITEHLFFGLVHLQAGEPVFLEEQQRLEKWAPAGWKAGSSGGGRGAGGGGTLPRSPFNQPAMAEQFVLHLRFRYYPRRREFVKTAITAHQLYLQLRQDMLSGALRFQPREKAVEMAALALCVECGRPPTAPGDYFKLENYLPSKFYDLESGEIVQVHRQIGTAHAQLAGHFGRLEAEERFVQMCQAEPYYGAHFYRVHKMKPKRGAQPFFSDQRLLAVMPSGVGVCREERGGARRLFTSLHEWHQIRTLQFDRKRFLLGTVEAGIAVDHVFYTDHHSKAAYLVRFAASQHRFVLKMRQWQGTLNRMRAMRGHRDVGVDGSDQGGPGEGLETMASSTATVPMEGGQGHRRNGSQPQMGIGTGQKQAGVKEEGRRQSRLLAETDKEYIQYCYGPDAQRVDVILEKQPQSGLGLTLVDGAVNGVKGVYVKSVSAEGDGRRKGLLVGDCLLSINGISLFNRTRHDAVELVRDCGREVRLEILRFPSISEVLAQEPLQSVLSGAINGKAAEKHTDEGEKPASARRRSSSSFLVEEKGGGAKLAAAEEPGKRKESTMTTQSRTNADSSSTLHSLTAPNAAPPNSSNSAAHRRQRAVSDFGCSLPALRTDDLLAAVTPKGGRGGEEQAQRYRRHKTTAGLPERSSGSEDSASSDEDSDSEQSRAKSTTDDGTASSAKRGEYQPRQVGAGQLQQLPPVSAMYGALEDEEEEELEQDKARANGGRQKQSEGRTSAGFGTAASPYVSSSNNNSPFAAAVERFTRLDASNGNNSSNSNGGGKRRDNLDWTNELSEPDFDASSAKSASEEEEEVFSAILDKTENSPIGLSLAKRMGHEGVYVRNIAPESLAAREGTLRIGDRIWRIQGEQLGPEESPASVVKLLKEARGRVRLEVRRKRTE